MAHRPSYEPEPGSPSAVRILPPEPPRASSGLPPRTPPPATRRAPSGLLVGAVIVIALGSLVYGYRVGEQNRADREVTVTTAATTAPTVAPPTTAPVGPFEETVAEFLRRAPGHEVPENATEYLAGNAILALAVAPDGFIWSAGPGGVVRWDPNDGSYEHYTSPDGAGPIGALDIAISSEGDVWVLTRTGLSHWDGAEWLNDSDLQAFGREIDLDALAVDGHGTVWIASTEWAPSASFGPWPEPRFMIHHGDTPFTGDVDTYVLPAEVHRLETASDGSVWATIDNGIWRFDDGRWELAIDAGMGWLHDLAFEPDGSVLLAGDRSVRRWTGGVLTPIEIDDALFTEGADGHLEAIAVDDAGVGWVMVTTWNEPTGETRELIRLDDLSRFSTPDLGFSEDLVVTNGAVWVGGDGLTSFDGEEWAHYRVADTPSFRWLDSIAADESGSLWIASGEQLTEFDGTVWSVMTRADLGLPAPTSGPWGWDWQPAWIAGGGDRALWAGFGCTVATLQGAEWTVIGRPPEVEDDDWCWAEQRLVGPDGSLWMVTEGDGPPRVHQTDGATWSVVDRPRERYVASIALAADGTLWAAGDGVAWLDGDEWRTSLGGIEFQTMTIGGDGSVWAAEHCWGCSTDEARLWHMVDGLWNVEETTHVERLTTAPDGTVWTIGREGFGPQVLRRYDDVGIFRRVMAGDDLSAVAFAPDGSAWVAGEGRLIHLEDLAG